MPLQTGIVQEKVILPPSASVAPPATPPHDETVLDWDVHIATPPPRAQGTVSVQFVRAGRSRPLAVADPETVP